MTNILRPPCDEAVIRTAAHPTPCAKSAEPWILAATILGSSIAFIDGTVVNVALPALQSGLNATVIDVQWVVEMYALFLAALLLVGGSLGDRFGRKRIFAIGVAIFALASAWCGFAPNVRQLIAARAIQGIGGALLVPGSLAIISGSISEDRRGRAIGIWSGFTSITAAIGPLIGGWMIDNISWRAAFFINLPVAAVVLLIVFWQVPESRDPAQQKKSLDYLGTTFATLGLGAFVYALLESPRLGFRNPLILISSAAGILLLAAFIVHEKKTDNPMLPMQLFRSRDFTGTNLLTLFLYAALGGALFFYPLNLIQIQGYSATAAGASFLPFVLLMFFLSPWTARLLKRYGARVLLMIGPIIAAFGFALFALPGIHTNYWSGFFPAIVLVGLGMALTVAPLTTTVMSSVRKNQAGVASGVNNAVSRLAALLAIAVFGVVMLHSFNNQLDRELGPMEIDYEARSTLDDQRVKLAAIEIPKKLPDKSRAEIREAVNRSFVSGFRLVMFLAAALAVASAVSSYFYVSARERKP